MKKILILGAGIYQIPLIKKANEMGLYTIVASKKGNYPGFEIAKKKYYVDTTNKEEILKIAKENKISGICTIGTDVAVKTIGYVCEKLDLKGISYSAAEILTNKFLMKESFEKNNLCSSKYKKIRSYSDALETFDFLKKPVVIKAVNSSGSRGVVKVEHKKDIKGALDYAKQYTNLDYLIMEEFIHGYEIGIDGYVKNHKIVLFLPHDKLIYNNGYTNIPAGHIFSFELTNYIDKECIIKQLENYFRNINFNNSAFNIDAFITKEGVSYIEIGGRCGATGIPELISTYCGYNYYEKIINEALGIDEDFSSSLSQACGSRLIFSDTSGYYESISYSNLNNVRLFMDVKKGDRVFKTLSGADRIGCFFVKGKDHNDIKRKIDDILKKVKINISCEDENEESE